VNERRLHRLSDVGRSLVTVLDPDAVLERLLEVARELTGARYAAIGVLDERREGLERFVTAGIDEDTHRAIGDLPRGRGVLGVLITDPRPLRLTDVGTHPQSYGFPLAHPPMKTFLGVPIVIDGRAWGNLYLTDKAEPFTADDEEAVVVLSDWATIAIANARLYRTVRERRDELERTIRGLETTTEISRALGGVTDLERVLELVVKRSRALIDARAAEIALVDGDELVIAAAAGEESGGRVGTRLPLGGALASGIGTIVASMAFRNRAVGYLRLYGDRAFSEEDERLLRAFAASAATAVATAQNASEEALRRGIEASEAERTRWARELHDETLQQLAGLRVLLSGARRSGDPERMTTAIDAALEQITTGIGDLRSLITELRPAALDELGVPPALESLVARLGRQTDVEVDLDVELGSRYTPEIESTLYRLVQEALTNVVRHSRASRVAVSVAETGGVLRVTVRDDGDGFDARARSSGFGLMGMRERLALVNGTLEVSSSGSGTTVSAVLPAQAPSSRERSVAAITASRNAARTE
jgi:signal transduction histidine kinase